MKLDSPVEMRDATRAQSRPFLARLPAYTYVGLLLNAVGWTLSWQRIGPLAYLFFAIWFGFILVLDGLNVARSGTSLLRRGVWRFVLLFVFSAAFWWVFEAFNAVLNNWHYTMDRPYSALEYNIAATINFSTVLPAVLEMAELLGGLSLLRPRGAVGDVRLSLRGAVGLMAVGAAMLTLLLVAPRYFYGTVWLTVIFLVDPINNLARRPSAFGRLLARDWRFLVTYPLAGLVCGFFWEMWNSRALPRWDYTVPFFDHVPHLFAMPLPGYLGYLPFAVELFVMYQFVLLLVGLRRDRLVV